MIIYKKNIEGIVIFKLKLEKYPKEISKNKSPSKIGEKVNR